MRISFRGILAILAGLILFYVLALRGADAFVSKLGDLLDNIDLGWPRVIGQSATDIAQFFGRGFRLLGDNAAANGLRAAFAILIAIVTYIFVSSKGGFWRWTLYIFVVLIVISALAWASGYHVLPPILDSR
jgi:hypothetical protein